jgi:hypothetical protein
VPSSSEIRSKNWKPVAGWGKIAAPGALPANPISWGAGAASGAEGPPHRIGNPVVSGGRTRHRFQSPNRLVADGLSGGGRLTSNRGYRACTHRKSIIGINVWVEERGLASTTIVSDTRWDAASVRPRASILWQDQGVSARSRSGAEVPPILVFPFCLLPFHFATSWLRHLITVHTILSTTIRHSLPSIFLPINDV